MGLKEHIWRIDATEPWNVLVNDGRVFYFSSTREQGGRWLHRVNAADLHTGRSLWQKDMESRHGRRDTALIRLNFVGGGIVLLLERNELAALSAEDGRELWRHTSEAEARVTPPKDSRQAGHFYREPAGAGNGEVWVRQERAQDGRAAPEKWLVLDPETGETVREIDASGLMGVLRNANKIGCQTLTATCRFLHDGRLATSWDLETGRRHGWKFARGGCGVGIVPANGLGYIPPNACGCHFEQLRRNAALVETEDPGLYSDSPGPLQEGPAYGRVKAPRGDDCKAAYWPTYRRDSLRSSYLPAGGPADMEEIWRRTLAGGGDDIDGEWALRLGQLISAPVIGNDLVLISRPQTHQVIALDRAGGRIVWRFTAGGRVPLPPTIYGDLVLFGSNDGYVYALRKSDGELAWRLRAAPSDRRILAYGQVESAWPVWGGVLVQDGVALAAAGRAVDSDGGVLVHGFNPEDGTRLWSHRVRGPGLGGDALHGTGDLLVSDGGYVYLMNKRFDVRTGEVLRVEQGSERSGREWIGAERQRRQVFPGGERYLRSSQVGLTDMSWTRFRHALRKNQSNWTWATLEGELLAFSDDDIGYAYQVDAGEDMWRSVREPGGGMIKAREAHSEENLWKYRVGAPAQVQAMLITRDSVVLAGPADRGDPHGNGFLLVLSLGGEVQRKLSLTASPIPDGIAAAEGEIFAALYGGTVIKLGPE